MEESSFLRFLAEAATGVQVPPPRPAGQGRSSSPARAHPGGSSNGNSNGTGSRGAASSSTYASTTVGGLFSNLTSPAVSRASSRRSSVDLGIGEDAAQRNAVREAVIRRDLDELRRLAVKGYVHDAMRRLVW